MNFVHPCVIKSCLPLTSRMWQMYQVTPLHGVESLHGIKANHVIDLRYFETTLWSLHSNVGSESLHLSLHHSSGCYATNLWSHMVGFMLYSINQNSRVTMVYLLLHNDAKCMFHTSNQDHWIVAYFLLTCLSKWGHIVRITVQNGIPNADSWLLLFGFKTIQQTELACKITVVLCPSTMHRLSLSPQQWIDPQEMIHHQYFSMMGICSTRILLKFWMVMARKGTKFTNSVQVNTSLHVWKSKRPATGVS